MLVGPGAVLQSLWHPPLPSSRAGHPDGGRSRSVLLVLVGPGAALWHPPLPSSRAGHPDGGRSNGVCCWCSMGVQWAMIAMVQVSW